MMFTALLLAVLGAVASPLAGGAPGITRRQYAPNAAKTVQIHSLSWPHRCLGVPAAMEHAEVTLQDCNSTSAETHWVVDTGCNYAMTPLRLNGTDWCAGAGVLDMMGLIRYSGLPLSLWGCPTQQPTLCDSKEDPTAWMFTNIVDHGISFRANFLYCLESASDNGTIGGGVVIWECRNSEDTDDVKQKWTIA